MLDLLAAVVALALIVVVACAVALAVTVVPFVLTGDTAEQRGLSVAWAGAAQVVMTAVALLGALLVLRSTAPTALAVLPLAFAFVVPVLLRAVPVGAGPALVHPGAHER